jgi:hypothetical protein
MGAPACVPRFFLASQTTKRCDSRDPTDAYRTWSNHAPLMRIGRKSDICESGVRGSSEWAALKTRRGSLGNVPSWRLDYLLLVCAAVVAAAGCDLRKPAPPPGERPPPDPGSYPLHPSPSTPAPTVRSDPLDQPAASVPVARPLEQDQSGEGHDGSGKPPTFPPGGEIPDPGPQVPPGGEKPDPGPEVPPGGEPPNTGPQVPPGAPEPPPSMRGADSVRP